MLAYKLLASPEQLTEENIRLARILGWCMELVRNFLFYFTSFLKPIKFLFIEFNLYLFII